MEQQPGMLYTSTDLCYPAREFADEHLVTPRLPAGLKIWQYRKRLHFGRLIFAFPYRIGVSFSFWDVLGSLTVLSWEIRCIRRHVPGILRALHPHL